MPFVHFYIILLVLVNFMCYNYSVIDYDYEVPKASLGKGCLIGVRKGNVN